MRIRHWFSTCGSATGKCTLSAELLQPLGAFQKAFCSSSASLRLRIISVPLQTGAAGALDQFADASTSPVLPAKLCLGGHARGLFLLTLVWDSSPAC
jgi:hypothetical protein